MGGGVRVGESGEGRGCAGVCESVGGVGCVGVCGWVWE